MEGLSEGGSSDESDEDSDELEETDDATERRELSSSIIGETLDMSSKDL
jgi:hypothetical protein